MDDASVFRNRKESVLGVGSRGNLCVLLVPLVEAAALDQRLKSQGRSWAPKDGNAKKRDTVLLSNLKEEGQLLWCIL